MHYDGTLRGRFKSYPILKDKMTGKAIGINTEMSPTDIKKLNQMYHCSIVKPTTLTPITLTPTSIVANNSSCGKSCT